MDFKTMQNDELASALTEARNEVKALFALEAPTVADADKADALVASINAIENEQADRTAEAKAAADRFAAHRASFAAEDEEKEPVEDEDFSADADAGDEDEDADEDVADEADADADADAGEAVVTASAVKGERLQFSAAKAVGKRAKRPAAKSTPSVVITAAADVPKFATGQSLDGMEQVTEALLNRAKGFAPFNEASARAVVSQTSSVESISKFGVASFSMPHSADVTVDPHKGNDYSAVRNAIKARSEGALTAGGWCAPSETVYSFIADFIIDGLATVPEVSAPRGGIRLTTGPAKSTQGTALTDFGFTQTEAQAIARVEKTCETIECPPFVDHRLDAIGYCYKIPFLTQKAYPELITDALRLANVMYAHKVNKYVIDKMVGLSTAHTHLGYGATFTDALEALTILALRERRKWNLGDNALMEVKLPMWTREVFRADMSRRTGLALTDVATDQKIEAEFVARRLSVEYVNDWQEIATATALAFPGTFQAMVYPAGTFVKAVEDVVNLSAVHDAASLSINEYTGVFFEQGILVAKAGYGSSLLTVKVDPNGRTGAASLSARATA